MICWGAFILSALGSIPPGAINLWTSKIAIEKGLKNALLFAFASALLETPHILISIAFHSFLTQNESVKTIFDILTICFLLGLSLKLWLSKPLSNENTERQSSISLRQILAINLLNPFAIPFWLVMINYLEINAKESTILTSFWWIMCATLGCFLVLGLYALLAHQLKKYVLRVNPYLAAIYLLMALIKIYQNLYS